MSRKSPQCVIQARIQLIKCIQRSKLAFLFLRLNYYKTIIIKPFKTTQFNNDIAKSIKIKYELSVLKQQNV